MDDAEAPDGRLLLLDEALTSEAGVSHVGVHRGAMCSSMKYNARDGSPEQESIHVPCPLYGVQTWRGGRCPARVASQRAAWRSSCVTRACPWPAPKWR